LENQVPMPTKELGLDIAEELGDNMVDFQGTQ
jgi:hypothetical protein